MPLREQLHLRRPFNSVEEEALLSIFVTWDLLYSNLNRIMHRNGISLAQYNVLRILRGAGPDGLPLMTIAKRMVVRYPNITRLTDKLEADQLIQRERCTKDRRVVRAKVTGEGLEILARLDGEVDRLQVRLMRGADERSLKLLIRVLEEVRSGLRRGETFPKEMEGDVDVGLA
jgi:DNA-binding MarR family transcriptional regulator